MQKQIDNFQNYIIFDDGKIFSKNRNKFMKFTKSKRGDCKVILHSNGKPKAFAVHRLVAQAFIPNPNSLPQVNHKDENPSNNNVNNLEWCDAKYNINYGTGIERRSKSRIGSKLSQSTINKIIESKKQFAQKVYQYTLENELVSTYDSMHQASKMTNTPRISIYRCCNGIISSANGYKWSHQPL